MQNFIFENSTKVFFGKGCVKEFLASLVGGFGDTIMVAYGGGSIKKNGVYDQIMEILVKAGIALPEQETVNYTNFIRK